jgi:hypothetical protein
MQPSATSCGALKEPAGCAEALAPAVAEGLRRSYFVDQGLTAFAVKSEVAHREAKGRATGSFSAILTYQTPPSV